MTPEYPCNPAPISIPAKWSARCCGEGSEDHAARSGGIPPAARSCKGARRRYLAAHPRAKAFVDFTDFSLFRILPSGAHLVAGFGRIFDLKPEQFLTEIGDASALIEAEPAAVEHVNTAHRDTMNLYATRLLGGESGDWHCTSLDPDGIDLQAGETTLRLDFPERVTEAADLRKMLVKLAEEARGRTPF